MRVKEIIYQTVHAILNGKNCTSCNESKEWTQFGRNKSKTDGHESSCKQCVSDRKKKAYVKKKKELKKINSSVHKYDSSIEGELSEDAIAKFSEIFKEIYRGLQYEGKI